MNPAQNLDYQNTLLWDRRYDHPAENHSEALHILSEAERIQNARAAAYARLNLAYALFLLDGSDAYGVLVLALEYFSHHVEEKGFWQTLTLEGSILESFGEYEKALQNLLKAYTLAEKNNDHETLADAASTLGLIYTRLQNYEQALGYYQAALKIREEMGDFPAVASSLNRLGMISRLLKQYETSLQHYFKSLQIRTDNHLTGAIPYSLLGIASTCEEMGDNEKAFEYYKKGDAQGDKRCQLQCKTGAARVLTRMDRYDEAVRYLDDAGTLALEINSRSLLADVFAARALCFEKNGQIALALDALKNYLKTHDEVLNEESRNRLRKVEIAHAVENAEKEKEIYRLKHVELKAAFDVIEQKNKEITASISYASRIQAAILPDLSEFKTLCDRSFMLYLPKDIVSGDFYWFAEVENITVFTVADCTGHGVPGAFMSMLGISFLEEIVKKRGIISASEIVGLMREEVIKALHNTGKPGENKDGMDISLCIFEHDTGLLHFTGAYNPAYIVRAGAVIELEADRMPVGTHEKQAFPFTEKVFETKPGDMIYLSSDGYKDQFGGPDGRKYKASSLKEFLATISNLNLEEQCRALRDNFFQWKGNQHQIDDVAVMGVRI